MTSSAVPAVTRQHLWRTDITGLRALAVLPVLLFHAFPDYLPGGFFGVDIFFVISGYLISGIIFRGLLSNTFSYADFYAKRIRRILPNLILVLAFCFVMGWFWMSAREYATLGQHIYASAGFYQNFRLMGEAGYFDAASETKPLLHLWSLAIEEQFYIVFPIICAAVWKLTRSPRAILAVVLCITLGSLAACLAVVNPAVDFYFPLTRFWELGGGIVIAGWETFRRQGTAPKLARGLRHGLSLVGLLMIVVALGCYRRTIPAPGLVSLLPVVGAMLLILAHEDAIVNRTLLSWRWMTFIGLISYSLYLWHWPLLVFQHLIVPTSPAWVTMAVLIVSFVLATAVYFGVENPIRRMKTQRRWTVPVVLLCGLLLCVAGGQVIKHKRGLPERPMAVALKQVIDYTDENAVLYPLEVNGVKLETTIPGVVPEILFVGDSHQEQNKPRVKYLSEKTGKAAGFMVGPACLAAPEVYSEERPVCEALSRGYVKLLDNPRIHTMVFAGIWGGHLHREDIPLFVRDEFGKRLNLYEGGFELAMQRQADLLKRYAGQKTFFVILDYPWNKSGYDVSSKINRITKDWAFKDQFMAPYPSMTWWQEGNTLVKQVLSPYANMIETEPEICTNGECNLLFYRDADHLRYSFVRERATWLDPIFE